MPRKRQIMRHTTVAVALSLNVQVHKNGQSQLLTLPLLSLTRLLLMWWQIKTATQGWALSANTRIEKTMQAMAGITIGVYKALLFNIEFAYAPG